MSRSIEEQVEDFYKTQLKNNGIRYFTKTETLNEEIDKALKKAPSKSVLQIPSFLSLPYLIQAILKSHIFFVYHH